MKLTLLAAALALAVQSAVAGPTEDYDAEAERIIAQTEQGTLTELEASRQLADLAARLFPQDYRFQSFRNYRVLLTSRLERGEIKRDEFDYLWNERRLQFLAERDAINQQAAQDDARARAAGTAAALQSFGASVQRATAPSGIRCTTIGASTSCY